MTEYRFYQLGKTSTAKALLGILPKALERGMRAYILCDSEERAADTNSKLWADDPGSFLPHGLANENGAAEQPILIGNHDQTAANNANLLILTNGLDTANDSAYDLVCVMLDSSDEQAMQSSRKIWKRVTDAGNKASYWVQNDKGGWQEKKAG